MSTFTIGKLADAAGVHVETVRYYERRGLIEQPPRSPSSYRSYTFDHLLRLQLIRRAKGLGFTLTEIAELLGAGDDRSTDGVVAAVQSKLVDVEAGMQELAQLRCRLHRLMELCRSGEDADCVALRLPA